ncbi:MAG: tRNA (guanosine(37)-N1)-methyltransferase TrmD [Endomicrobium sp.]|jgi:tRNA (guanine37-N1)-methyltransferase|nr:tRNA (guanosine(37)-N1)-methyltransferase TrmD [Endomicrobium sp.]
MKIDVLTIFPAMFEGPLTESLIGKARQKEILKINMIDIRSFSKDKHGKVDDKSFGGGAGMIMKLEPVYDAIKSTGVKKKNKDYKNFYNKPYVIYMSPQGRTLNCNIVKELSKFKHLVILCGHYEGIDERIMNFVDDEISIGDYVLTGGELPAMVLIDCMARMVSGVIKEKSSVENDSFYNNLLDYPHYTRPSVFKGIKVPEILLSGNHKKIEQWRKKESAERTKKRRPDLLKRIRHCCC